MNSAGIYGGMLAVGRAEILKYTTACWCWRMGHFERTNCAARAMLDGRGADHAKPVLVSGRSHVRCQSWRSLGRYACSCPVANENRCCVRVRGGRNHNWLRQKNDYAFWTIFLDLRALVGLCHSPQGRSDRRVVAAKKLTGSGKYRRQHSPPRYGRKAHTAG